MMNTVAGVSWRRVQLWSELVALYVGLPLLMVAFFDRVLAWGFLGSFALIVTMWALAAFALALLAVTPGFSFRRIRNGAVLREWRLILGSAALTAAACVAIALLLLPERLFGMPLYRTSLWLVIMVAYPVLSALPQEIIFRSLFFERYGSLFPGTLAAVAANGAAFGLGHLFFMNPVTIGMTALGGALIGWAYLARGRSLMLAWVLHSLAGQIVFTSGIGIFFYHRAAAAAMP
jgi:membrane protease YdiL (CAAX protease family)